MCVSGKYLMAGGETPSKQSREQRVGKTTAGRHEKRKQSTNRLPTSKNQRFVSSKEAFAGPGEFSELQHILCSAPNIPKMSSAGVLRAAKNSAGPLNRSRRNSPTVCNRCTWKHSDPAVVWTKPANLQICKCVWGEGREALCAVTIPGLC